MQCVSKCSQGSPATGCMGGGSQNLYSSLRTTTVSLTCPVKLMSQFHFMFLYFPQLLADVSPFSATQAEVGGEEYAFRPGTGVAAS